MICDLITSGRDIPCKSAGGVKAFYLANMSELNPVLEVDAETGATVITDFGVADAAFKWDIRSASPVVQTMTASPENGTVVVSQLFTGILHSLDYATDFQLKLFAYSNPFVIAHLNNGNAVLLGINWGCNLDTSVADTGGLIGDFNGYTLTVSAQEVSYAAYIVGSTLADPFAGMTNAPVIGANLAPGANPVPSPTP